MTDSLRYTDETDKSLGIAGMAIALVGLDCEKHLASVSLEADEEPFEMAREFFFSANPRQSARIAWNELLYQFQIISSVAMGNILCRAYVAGHSPSRQALDDLQDFIVDLGRETCSLEDYEARNAFSTIYENNNRLFTHPQIITLARKFATLLRVRRRMTAGEVIEQLSHINIQ